MSATITIIGDNPLYITQDSGHYIDAGVEAYHADGSPASAHVSGDIVNASMDVGTEFQIVYSVYENDDNASDLLATATRNVIIVADTSNEDDSDSPSEGDNNNNDTTEENIMSDNITITVGEHTPATRPDEAFKKCADITKNVLANLEIKGGLKVCNDVQFLKGQMVFRNGMTDSELLIDSRVVLGVAVPEGVTLESGASFLEGSVDLNGDGDTSDDGEDFPFTTVTFQAATSSDASDPYGELKSYSITTNAASADASVLGVIGFKLPEGASAHVPCAADDSDATHTAKVKFYMKNTRMGAAAGAVEVTYSLLDGLTDIFDMAGVSDNKIQSLRDLVAEIGGDAVELNNLRDSIVASTDARIQDLATQVDNDLASLNAWLIYIKASLENYIAEVEAQTVAYANAEDERIINFLLALKNERRFAMDVTLAAGSGEDDDADCISATAEVVPSSLAALADPRDWMFDARIIDGDNNVVADQVDFTAKKDGDALKVNLRAMLTCTEGTDDLKVALTAIFCGDEDEQELVQKYIDETRVSYNTVSFSAQQPAHTADNDTSGLGLTGAGGSHDNDEAADDDRDPFQAISSAEGLTPVSYDS
tara:strand:+ start:500 stop:2284 length:1785 start_codon:yes stop_codon:yes gene_type:complete